MFIFLYCCFQTNPEIVKRWSNEVQEGIQSRSALVQFHALALLHQVSLLHWYYELANDKYCCCYIDLKRLPTRYISYFVYNLSETNSFLTINHLIQIRQNDRLAVSKLVVSLTRGSVRSPLAQCLLIRYTSQVSFLCCSIIWSVGEGICVIRPLFLLFRLSVTCPTTTTVSPENARSMNFWRVACAIRQKW